MPINGDYAPSPAPWTRSQVEEYEASGGLRGATLPASDMKVIIVTTIGWKTGKVRKFAVMRVEHGGEYALVASMGGQPTHPLWYHNLKAHPDVMIQDGPRPLDYRTIELTGEQRELWWGRAVAEYPPYTEYQAKTDRLIPVFLASPAGGSDGE